MDRTSRTSLGAMTWTELERPIVVVPVGSCEQHGPHLPLHTDTTIACALADALAERRGDCVVAPPLTITASGEHQGFPGTLSVGTEIMAGIVIELARSADWASGVVFVNGHGGNITAMQRAAEVFDHERRKVLIWWPRFADADPHADPHAGHTETSLMLALAPDRVRSDRAVAGPVPSAADVVTRGVRRLSESGVLGDPNEASAAAGAEIFATLAAQLASAVEEWTTP